MTTPDQAVAGDVFREARSSRTRRAVLALATGGAVAESGVALLGTGFCGALTTFSTFSFETLGLVEQGAVREGLLNVLVSLVAGVGAAAAGYYATSALV